jgi:beta-glucosidase
VAAGQGLEVSVDVTNVGDRAGDEVVQLYVRDVDASVPVPIRSLQGFERVTLAPGERRTVRFAIAPRSLSVITEGGERVVEPGVFEIAVGGKQPGFTGFADAHTTGVVSGRVEVTGAARVLPR